jgi:hypothetical protein
MIVKLRPVLMKLSLSHSMRTCTVVAALSLGLPVACTKSEASPPPGTFDKCVPGDVVAHDSPEAAFSAYVLSLNRADFCESLRFYEEEDRLATALMAFRTLVITAGAQSPRQAEYAAQFSEVCQHYGLGYSNPSEFVGLFLSLLHDDDWISNIANVQRVAAQDPASFYTNVMRRVHDVQPSAAVKISPQLSGLTLESETATADASRSDGKTVKVALRQISRGWVLTISENMF